MAEEEFAAFADEVPAETGAVETEAELALEAGADDMAGLVCDGGLGASTPAVLEPRPSFCRLGASSLPLAFMPLSD